MDITQALEDALSKVTGWLESLVEMTPEIIAAIVILVLVVFVARGVKNVVQRLMGRATDHGPVQSLVAKAAYLAVWTGGLFLALIVLDLDGTVTSLLAGLGIVGLALGFAFQDIAQNLISGIIISIRRPFTDGDLIRTDGYFGVVEDVDLRATLLRSLEGQLVRIPNARVYGESLVNYSHASTRLVSLGCGVQYDSDLERVRDVALESARSVPGRAEGREPEFFYEEFGGSSINFILRIWLADTSQPTWLRARSEAVIALKKAFDENDIGIPFPIRTLDFSRAGTRTLDEPLESLAGGMAEG